jgi:prepilin-type N-terminal cleavage/methylation domain-containing protein/prepilin-type processing-associated H-X9-DG protein
MSRFISIGAFTLVELLVVMAIIGILSGLLLPALVSSRDQARETACMSNLRQIGMGFTMYSDDYSEYMPRGYVKTSSSPGRYYRWYHAVNAYIDEMQTFQCPNGHEAKLWSDQYLDEPPQMNYVYNVMKRDSAYISDGPSGDLDPGAHGFNRMEATGHYGLGHVSAARVAPDTFLLMDGGVGDRSIYDGKALYGVATSGLTAYRSHYDWRNEETRSLWAYLLPGVNHCHSGQLNALVFDGHVEATRETPFHRLTIRTDNDSTYDADK